MTFFLLLVSTISSSVALGLFAYYRPAAPGSAQAAATATVFAFPFSPKALGVLLLF